MKRLILLALTLTLSIVAAMAQIVPDNCIPGVFSVSADKKVYFCKGNLQYQPSSNTWRFAEKQYTLLDDNPETHTTTSYTATSIDWIDLFGWGMWLDEINDKSMITNTSTDNSEYAPTLSEKNNSDTSLDDYLLDDYVEYYVFANNKKTVDGVEWMTLSYSEWYYLRFIRNNGSDLWGVAMVNGVNGMIILPDQWLDPEPDGKVFRSGVASNNGVEYFKTLNEYTAEQWSMMEAAGAVFLPAAGCRKGLSVRDVCCDGFYWLSASYDNENARRLYFNSSFVSLHRYYCHYGFSVRLVRPL